MADTGSLPSFAENVEGNLLILTCPNRRLDDDEELLRLVRMALTAGKDVIVSGSNAVAISSLFIEAMMDAAVDAKTFSRKFVAVMHPKARLLIRMFGLDGTIPLADTLDQAKAMIHPAGSAAPASPAP